LSNHSDDGPLAGVAQATPGATAQKKPSFFGL
jgi:hypothetical protein